MKNAKLTTLFFSTFVPSFNNDLKLHCLIEYSLIRLLLNSKWDTVKFENWAHTYFSAKTCAYTFAQINFSANTYFRKKTLKKRFCLINATPGLNSVGPNSVFDFDF